MTSEDIELDHWDKKGKRVTYTTTTETERFDCGLFDGPTSVAYADTPLSVAVSRRGVIVGGGGGGVVGHSAR
jgi:hypothetical protein